MCGEKYIYEQNNGYCIFKQINHVRKYFGWYKTLTEARRVRDDLISNGWGTLWTPKKYKGNNESHNIYRVGDGKFRVSKIINKEPQYYGVFSDFEEAKFERDLLESYDYDFFALCECE